MSHNHSAIVVVVGEILFDLINGQKHLGGAPFNFAYHLLHLGFPVRFISRIGNDANGKEILNKLKGFQFPAADIQVDPDFETGTVHVELDRLGSPRFDIAAPVAYDHIEFIEDSHLSILNSAACLYFGSLVQRSPCGRLQIRQFLQNIPKSGGCFYDINLRPDCYTEAVIKQSLNHATILKLNTDELEICRQLFAPETKNSTFVRQLMDRFTIAQVVLTKGAHGCTLYDKNGPHESTPAVVNTMSDSVGAGDALAAMFCACTLNNCSPDQSLFAASHFASRICEISGAIPESPGFYAPYKKIIDQRTSHGII
jgi:fructokinase